MLWDVDPLLGNDREFSSCATAIAMYWPQQIHNMQQWNNWEQCYLCCPCDSCVTTVEELLGKAFSVWSTVRLYNKEQLWL
jgi:hypothetical protein